MAVTKEEAAPMLELLNSNCPMKRHRGRERYAELEEREWRLRKEHVDLTELQRQYSLNFPEKPISYLPAVILFLFTFGMIVYALS